MDKSRISDYWVMGRDRGRLHCPDLRALFLGLCICSSVLRKFLHIRFLHETEILWLFGLSFSGSDCWHPRLGSDEARSDSHWTGKSSWSAGCTLDECIGHFGNSRRGRWQLRPDRYWFFAIVGLLAMAGWPVGKKHCGSIWSWWQTVALWLRKLCDSGLMNGL